MTPCLTVYDDYEGKNWVILVGFITTGLHTNIRLIRVEKSRYKLRSQSPRSNILVENMLDGAPIQPWINALISNLHEWGNEFPQSFCQFQRLQGTRSVADIFHGYFISFEKWKPFTRLCFREGGFQNNISFRFVLSEYIGKYHQRALFMITGYFYNSRKLETPHKNCLWHKRAISLSRLT